MINGLSAQGKYMYIHGGHSSGPYVNMSNPSAGMMRYNGSNNNTEVYDGMSWVTMGGSIGTVGLNVVAESAIDWALKKWQKSKNGKNWQRLQKLLQ
jgi:hypothetical protein